MAQVENSSKRNFSILGNLTIRFRQCASVLALIGCGTPHSTSTRLATGAGSAAKAVLADKPPGPATSELEPSTPPLAELPTTLELDGFEPSVLRLATDRRPAPLFVITHGAGGQAAWHCHHYEQMLGPTAGLLCLAGKRMVARDPTRGFYYPDHMRLSDELSAAHAAMFKKYSGALLGTTSVYIGYSQGATMGVLAIAPHGDIWPRLALVEGGYDSWSSALARNFKDNGGQRVLFVCGTEHCRKLAAQARSTLERTGVEARLLTATNAGHRPDGPVAARVKEGLIWLLQGDPHYEDVLNHLNAAESSK